MSVLLDRLRREDPSALEEVGYRLLPFVQAALLGQALELRESTATLKAFAIAVADAAHRSSDDAAFGRLVLQQLRDSGSTLPAAAPAGAQADALTRLAALKAMPGSEQELVLARFVERLGARRIAEETGHELSFVSGVLSRGATLLVGPPAGGGDWAANPSVADPDFTPAPELVELENLLSALAIDVTALELQPLKSPLPGVRMGPRPEPPAEPGLSRVLTQGGLDLPVQASSEANPRPVAQPTKHGLAPRRETGNTADDLLPVELTDVELPPIRVELTPAAPRPPPGSSSTVVDLTPVGRKLVPLMDDVTDPSGSAFEGATRPRVGWSPPPPPDRIRPRPMIRRIDRTWWWGATAFCAVLGVSLYLWAIGRVTQTTRSGWDLVPVIVAARDLPEGEVLTLELVATRAVPERFVTPSVVKPDLLKAALGQRLSVALQAGDHLQWAQFDSVRSQQRLSKRVSRSQRAYAIPVSEVKSVGGWLEPDQAVDLVMTVGGDTEAEAITLLQNIKLLAVGGVTTLQIGGAHLKYTTLSLLLDPEEARDLAVALRVGDLTATLRREGESELIPREGRTTLQTLLVGARVKALQRKRFETIQTIRGRP